jgi:hypothetical protein
MGNILDNPAGLMFRLEEVYAFNTEDGGRSFVKPWHPYAIWCCNPEECSMNFHRCENLKSYKIICLLTLLAS